MRRLHAVRPAEFDERGLTVVSFCGHCGTPPGAEVVAAGSRVCAHCGLGLVLQAPADVAPRGGEPFLVIDSSLVVCSVSARAEELLETDERSPSIGTPPTSSFPPTPTPRARRTCSCCSSTRPPDRASHGRRSCGRAKSSASAFGRASDPADRPTQRCWSSRTEGRSLRVAGRATPRCVSLVAGAPAVDGPTR